ncbi:MAG TPA: histidine triad nucleotide-binding protein [Jatrophihabitans sp.]|nr:histidine triad nucleotide-binding protein [Jatrophihabitans sp.]
MQPDCVFCRIVAGQLPADIVHQGEDVLAFNDLNPQAPVHVLVVPKRHVADISALAADPELSAILLAGIRGVTDELGITEYRTVFNTGAAAGQTVFHVHAHLLAGRSFGWPPG